MQPFDQIDDPVKLRRLVQAILILDAELNLPVVLRRIIEEARDLVDAQYGALGVLSADGQTLDQFLTVGLSSEEEHAIGPRPTGRGVLGTLIVDDKPLRLAHIADSPDSFGFPEQHPRMASFLGVPVRVHGEVYGNLYLTNKRHAKEFSADDEELVLALAMAAGIAIENARLHSLVRDRALTEDRDRIARDLHDSVIQRLFAIGLSLQGTARLVERPEAIQRIGEAIDRIDETIRQLRKAIFDIELTINKEGLHPKVIDLVHELRPVLGIHPQVSFSGPVDLVVTGNLAEEVLAVLREALTNVGKHAGAARVIVTVAVGDELRVVVADDGIGMNGNEGSPGGLGLKNMRQRAERRGGNMEIGTSREGGTRLTWHVPLEPAGAGEVFGGTTTPA
ncbi:MAG TPA: GAF domain-containing sensor histidine kinase [Acidimicrobiales bacterium]|nr:GAF domain-containing sensor histidine kinase [Acidimicrobiales bacterium]